MKNITKKELNRIAKEYGYDRTTLRIRFSTGRATASGWMCKTSKTTAQTATSEKEGSPSGRRSCYSIDDNIIVVNIYTVATLVGAFKTMWLRYFPLWAHYFPDFALRT